MAVTYEDDPIEACYFDQNPVETIDRDGNAQTHRVLRVLRAHVKEHDEKAGKADLLVFYPDRRLNKTAVPYAPGKPGSWGWPNDK